MHPLLPTTHGRATRHPRRFIGVAAIALGALISCKSDLAPSALQAIQLDAPSDTPAFIGKGHQRLATHMPDGLTAAIGIDGLHVETSAAPEAPLALRLSAALLDHRPLALPDRPTLGPCDIRETCGNKVTLDHGAVQEWWRATDDGLEHGFSVSTTAPAATLSVHLDVSGAELTWEDPAGPTLHLSDDTSLTYTGIYAWDDAGRALASSMQPSAHGIALVVDTHGAQWPVHIDPLLSTEHWSATGGAADDYFGYAVTGAGDLDNDGYDDVVVTAYGFDAADNEGSAYVYMGSATGVATTPDLTLTPTTQDDAFSGQSVANAGDVNDDGLPDLLVGAPRYDSSTTQDGQAYLYLSDGSGLNTTPSNSLSPTSTYGAYFGSSVASAGDVDADGHDDIIIGAPRDGSSDEGIAYLFLGSGTGVNDSEDWTVEGNQATAYLGTAVAPGGDLNGDGYDDFIVGASNYNGDAATNSGTVWVWLGSLTGPGAEADWYAEGDESNAEFGSSVAALDDVNGDGMPDILVGAPGHDGSGTDEGTIYLYYGPFTGGAPTAAATPDWSVSSGQDGANMGNSVASAGDANADGYTDFLAGAQAWDGDYTDEGAVFSWHGAMGGPLSATAWSSEGGQANSGFGVSVAGVGDINGDEYDDAIVGAHTYDDGSTSNTGRAVVYTGDQDDADEDGFTFWDDCDDTDPLINPDATEIPGDGVDQDCDGYELCYVDDDGDGYRTTDASETRLSTSLTCTGEGDATSSAPATDCDDTDDDIYPGAREYCNGEDDDCDGSIDEDPVDADRWYRDTDGDGYGDNEDQRDSCEQPTDYVSNNDDCDDNAASIHPGADEVCNNQDDDCDGSVDNNAVDAPTWYEDDDDDGYGQTDRTRQDCDEPTGYADDKGDCDDDDEDIHPGAPEYCDNTDHDCDGDTELGAVDANTLYQDRDGDGFGNGAKPLETCNDWEDGYTDITGDCDDRDDETYPDADDDPEDGEDSDCGGESERSWVGGSTLFGCATASGSPATPLLVLLGMLLAFVRRRPTLAAALLAVPLLTSADASAAERFDAHGFNLVADDGDPLDMLSTWRPEHQRRWAVGGLMLGEYAQQSLLTYSEYDGDVDDDVLRDDIFAVNMGASLGLGKRFALTTAVPWYPSANDGPWGDVRIATPWGLALTKDPERGGGLSLIPWVDIPTGDELHFLGNRGFGGGTMLAFGGGTPRWQLSANAGAAYAPLIEFQNLRGGPYVIAALGAAFMVGENTAIRLEGNYRPSLVENDEPGTSAPGETLLSLRQRYASGLHWTGGLATAVSAGAGASPLRLFAGVGWSYGKTNLPDQDKDGIVDSFDKCPEQPEVFNDFEDRDGCPDVAAALAVRVVNDAGEPVVGAAIQLKKYGRSVTDDTGVATFSGLTPFSEREEMAVGGVALSENTGKLLNAGKIVRGSATHPHFRSAEFDVESLNEGDNIADVTLRYREIPVTVTSRGTDGQPINARLRFEGPEPRAPIYVGKDGYAALTLRPGDWRILVSADEHSTERRDVSLAPGQPEATDLMIEFGTATAIVDADQVRILEQIFFAPGKDIIRADSMPLIAQVSNVLLDNPHVLQVEVQGHSDADGDADANMLLSQHRVEAVCKELIKNGVATERLAPRGYGESQPIASNDSDEGKALNRRVQFVIISMGEPQLPDASPDAPTTAQTVRPTSHDGAN